MALTVEDGTGITLADSYVALADVEDYADAIGVDISGYADPLKEVSAREATTYLDGKYGRRWRGTRNSRTQGLDWPRSGAIDTDGYVIGEAEVPKELIRAGCELTIRHLTTGNLQPDVEPGSTAVESEDSVGPISSRRRFFSSPPSETKRPKIDRLLSKILTSASRELVRS